MATVNIYLWFNGNCETAFDFYKSVFGGEFSYMGRYRDMPAPYYSAPDADKDKIMHVRLPVNKDTVLMGCDLSSECPLDRGNNFAFSVTPESEDDARRIFNALSEGGSVTTPLDTTFWGALHGMLTDKFGVNWMVNYSLKQSSIELKEIFSNV